MKRKKLVWKKTDSLAVVRWTAAREDGLLPAVMVINYRGGHYFLEEISGGLFQRARPLGAFVSKLTTAKRNAQMWHNRHGV